MNHRRPLTKRPFRGATALQIPVALYEGQTAPNGLVVKRTTPATAGHLAAAGGPPSGRDRPAARRQLTHSRRAANLDLEPAPCRLNEMRSKPELLATVVEPHVDRLVRAAPKGVRSDTLGAMRSFPRARKNRA
jgi:hypothetical protein